MSDSSSEQRISLGTDAPYDDHSIFEVCPNRERTDALACQSCCGGVKTTSRGLAGYLNIFRVRGTFSYGE